ncbi:hypothetical protein E3Q22_03178 [Wallemia mellicola]|uniref:Phosphatidylglycerol lysyltransferase C-terminal domain-containing protein n=1 Tax=Wallemia mellicola TaxID=1708541 RepID=A0A4T0P455_9BASI|nr:hypothetical protein E3Q24_02934 [Wallemia mellicola]TIB75602.1 hypothetical protein E3Q23_02306 [Wallemia mellicola]TIB77156.1 hypothetical protein E3Q22_03178 [Wallemia mellicola]TIB83015.1 hypothetical protein E3Q21_03126 [Wallemia mellicola]TIB85763.1 hypothetical protein E3Q20_03118 [Wallemia mellicola]
MKSDITDSISNSYNQPAGPSWLDQRYLVWKEFGKNQHTSESSSSEDDEEDTDKGVKEAIQGYTQHKNYVIAWGSPLCDKTRWPIVSRKFIHFCQSNGWTCVWTCVESEFEHVLAEAELNWSSLSCIRQDIVDLTHVNLTRSRDVRNNVRRSNKAGLAVQEALEIVDADKTAVEQGIHDWKKKRTGLQIATQDLQPWVDLKHRRVFYARHLESGKIWGFTVIAKISQNCQQIEHSVTFPNAPRGVSEHLLHDVLETLQSEGTLYCSFGISAADKLVPTNNLSSMRMAWLSKMYNSIVAATGLTNRGAFREKFDVDHQPLFICYPKGKFGTEALNALMKSVHTK